MINNLKRELKHSKGRECFPLWAIFEYAYILHKGVNYTANELSVISFSNWFSKLIIGRESHPHVRFSLCSCILNLFTMLKTTLVYYKLISFSPASNRNARFPVIFWSSKVVSTRKSLRGSLRGNRCKLAPVLVSAAKLIFLRKPLRSFPVFIMHSPVAFETTEIYDGAKFYKDFCRLLNPKLRAQNLNRSIEKIVSKLRTDTFGLYGIFANFTASQSLMEYRTAWDSSRRFMTGKKSPQGNWITDWPFILLILYL